MKTAHRRAAHAKRQNQDHYTSWIRVIAGNKEQPTENADQINIAIRKAYELLKCGQASDADFDRVASALNVGLIRAELIDPLAEQTMQAGIDAMYSCAEIYKRHGRYGFTGPDIVSVNDAINLYEDILRLSTPKMMCNATAVAFRRVNELARGGGSMKPSTAQMALEALSCHFCGHKTAVRIVSAEELSRESEEDGDAPSFYPHSDAFAVMCDASTTLGLGGCGATAGFAETELAAVARWNARCTSADLAAKVEPFGWTVSGCNEILKGEYAESDAKSDAARCGGTACAIALYEAPQQAEAPKSFEKLYAENSQGIEIERLKMQVESLTAERDALRADAERITKELLKCQQNQ